MGRCVSGFTLIEIMLAILIFAIVVTTVLTSFNMVFSSTPAINDTVAAYEMAANCLLRINDDLTAAFIIPSAGYAPPDLDDPPDPYRIVGGFERERSAFILLRFASLSHLPMGHDKRAGIAEIIYYLQEDDPGRYLVRRSDKLYPYPPFEPSSTDPVLCENVKSLTLTFYDKDGEGSTSWDSDDESFGYATPEMIGIKLVLYAGDFDRSPQLVFQTAIPFQVVRKQKE
jgi:general secretion pathway protein J